ncbi:zinc finger protein 333-like [Cryptotermes secundus]|uniref:zinc finger protein 333-like n=1 Tax=Cryptotermes secundus TaxID=105785 RepID=UPI000CD7C75C|nr:zinc finger protein 333-like [Cryptotermes secundus]
MARTTMEVSSKQEGIMVCREDRWYQLRIGKIFPALRATMDLADSENVQGLCSETCPASSCNAYQAISMKTEVLSDAGEEEYPVPITFPGIYAEPENPADLGKVQDMCNEIYPASSHDAYPAVSMKTEVYSDQEEEEYPVPLTFVGIKGEPEVIVCEPDTALLEKRSFYCDVCSKSFKKYSVLRIHQRTHSGERPFCCEVCNTTFKQYSHLKTHLRIHSEERPFYCNVCNKSFKHHSSLKIHKRIHSGERPFCCDICNKSFNVHSNLKRHERIHSW